MQIKTCPKGHRYDPNIYGDDCPLCAQSPSQYSNSGPRTYVATPQPAQAPQPAKSSGLSGAHTQVANPGQRPAPVQAQRPAAAPPTSGIEGETRVRPQATSTPHTVIRRPGAPQHLGQPQVRKLVGFLVTYNRNPAGKAYNIYEGRNTVGRGSNCDISVPDDEMMSGTHMSILYREADNKFRFRDEQSTNGTYLNKEITDEGELNNYDIIRVGSTIFIFIAIPKI